MSATDDERLTGLAASLARDDPRFARSLDEGRPAPPREYRRLRGWSWLAVATAALIAGVVLPHGLLLAAGLGPLVWIMPASRGLARASAALSSVADSPTLDFARAGGPPSRRLPPPPCSCTHQTPLGSAGTNRRSRPGLIQTKDPGPGGPVRPALRPSPVAPSPVASSRAEAPRLSPAVEPPPSRPPQGRRTAFVRLRGPFHGGSPVRVRR
ncbi:DUF3040 domain-containing protein [Streptomyces bobili]|uniref:DUF3040 domain-containing protein n=1 Tax=Streptomyces bobili TaxID=67280 RepID=A0ABZ1QT25_9ACTN|nr:DUF3040 domain-containing protein [Streptomyces bobili]